MSYINLSNISVVGIDNISRAQSVKEMFVKKKNILPNKISILNNLSFDAKKGDRIGILGLNGSGKTSLLKVIVGTYPIQSGTKNINGKIVSSLGMGSEFMTELTGRDNIKLAFAFRNNISEYNKSIEEKIIEFSELGDFIDKPMINYSSGMMARFAFSSIIFQRANILILDEVFATGDANFITKAKYHMDELWASVDIGIFVSHDQSQIREICKTCYIMSEGSIYDYGKTTEMINKYNKEILSK